MIIIIRILNNNFVKLNAAERDCYENVRHLTILEPSWQNIAMIRGYLHLLDQLLDFCILLLKGVESFQKKQKYETFFF